jgi:hypothetical protein
MITRKELNEINRHLSEGYMVTGKGSVACVVVWVTATGTKAAQALIDSLQALNKRHNTFVIGMELDEDGDGNSSDIWQITIGLTPIRVGFKNPLTSGPAALHVIEQWLIKTDGIEYKRGEAAHIKWSTF